MADIASFPVLAPGRIGGEAVQTINARNLHAFLRVGKDFSTWMKDRIAQYGFAEGVDFAVSEVFPDFGGNPSGGDCSPVSGSKGRGGHNRMEFAISIDMAKELSMVERNEQGRRARRYFIEMERRAKAATDPVAALNDPAALRSLLSDYAGRVMDLEGKVEEMRPQVQALERIAVSDGSMCITDAAKTLQVRPKELFAALRRNRWIYSRGGGAGEVAYQDKLARGVLEHKTTTVTRTDGSEKTVSQVRVTPKGLAELAKAFRPEGDLLGTAR